MGQANSFLLWGPNQYLHSHFAYHPRMANMFWKEHKENIHELKTSLSCDPHSQTPNLILAHLFPCKLLCIFTRAAKEAPQVNSITRALHILARSIEIQEAWNVWTVHCLIMYCNIVQYPNTWKLTGNTPLALEQQIQEPTLYPLWFTTLEVAGSCKTSRPVKRRLALPSLHQQKSWANHTVCTWIS